MAIGTQTLDLKEFPATPLQQGMLAHSLGAAGLGLYITQPIYQFKNIDAVALEYAINKTIDRHEILRTSYRMESDGALMKIHDIAEVKLVQIDWSEENSPYRLRTRLKSFLEKDRLLGFDFASAPLIRPTLILLSDAKSLLVFTHHHVILDGLSSPIVRNDILQFYNSKRKGHDYRPKEPPRFTRYLEWLSKRDTSADKEFWREYFDEHEGPTKLPYEVTNLVSSKARRFNSWSTIIPWDVHEEIKDVAKASCATHGTVYLASLFCLLYKHSGQQDIVMGVLFNGRPSEISDVERIVGMFMNTLPLRLKISGSTIVHELISSLQIDQARMAEHQYTPLTEIQKYSSVESGKAFIECILDNKISLTKHNSNKKESSATSFKDEDTTMGTQSVPLHFNLETAEQGIKFTITFDDQRFKQGDIAKLSKQFLTLVRSLSDARVKTVRELRINTLEEEQAILSCSSGIDIRFDPDVLLHQLFYNQVSATPNRIALIDSREELTYQQLLNKSRAQSQIFMSHGVNDSSVVTLLCDRSANLVISIIALLDIGATYIPLEQSTPEDRVNQILVDSGSDYLIHDRALLIIPLQSSVQYIDIGSREVVECHQPVPSLKPQIAQNRIAYILYTSGSTGMPKGIRVPHRVAVSRILSDQFPLLDDEVLISKTSHSFVDFVWEVFYPLSQGKTCLLAPVDAVKEPSKLVSLLAHKNAHRIVIVPSLLRLILELDLDSIHKIRHIKLWFSTGEPLTPDVVHRFYEILPESSLYNLYGASEVWDISLGVVAKDLEAHTSISSGRPMPNSQVYILDRDLNLVPKGVQGTIFVAGSHLAEKYNAPYDSALNDAFLEILINNQVRKMWNTGDEGYWDINDELVILGRRDTQVKLRGYRIDLNEIEVVAKKYLALRDCVVSLYNNESLALSYLTGTEQQLKTIDIKRELSHHLPSYMIPGICLEYDTFPYLSSGKVDRKALAKGIKNRLHAKDKTLDFACLSPVGETILESASSFFPDLALCITSNFFEMGGHSLMAVRFAAKLSKLLKTKVPLEKIFEYPVFSDLEAWIENAIERGEELSPIKHQESYDDLSPLSYPQRRLWTAETISQRNDTYILTNIARYHDVIDQTIMTQSINILTDRHDSLRTIFIAINGEPAQKVSDKAKVLYTHYESQICGVERPLTSLISQDSIKWDLEEGPLFKVYTINHADNSEIGLKIHHIISDGESIRIFYDELIHIYEALVRDKKHNLLPLSYQYRDYAIWQHDWYQSRDYQDKLDFWKSKLSGRTNRIDFLCTHPSPAPNIPRHLATDYVVRVGPIIFSRLRRLASQHRTTVFNIILAAYSIFLSRHASHTEINVGSPITGRDWEGASQLIGFFVNLIVYPIDVHEHKSFNEFISEVIDASIQSIKNQDVPFESIVNAIAPERDLEGQPLFQSMLVHEQVGEGGVERRGMTQKYYSSDHANYDILLLAREYPDQIEFRLHCRSKVFSPSSVRQMAQRFRTLVSRLARHCDKPISEVSMLPIAEYKKIVQRWNNTYKFNPYEDMTIAAIFRGLTQADPEASVVVDESRAYNRQELLRLAAKYQQLILKHVTSDSKNICLAMPKSAKQAAMVLAINGLGYTFVPCDYQAPVKRLNQIIEQTRASITIIDGGSLVSELDSTIILDLFDVDCRSDEDLSFFVQGTVNDLAYICFTSGSTGTPKGVMISNQNLVSLFFAHSNYFKLGNESRVLSTLGFYFDAGIGEQTRALLSGSTLYFSKDNLLQDTDRLVSLIKHYEITHIGLPPAVLESIHEEKSSELISLRVIVTAGEAVSPATACVWGANRTIITGHGATETTIGDTIAVNWNLASKAPLGRPLPNMKAYIVDSNFQVVPPYVPGELLIAGPQVAKGYLNDLDKTANSFLKDFISGSNSDMYRTGDRVYYDQKGIVYFQGRADKQLKIRGLRIEPGDIELCSLQCQEVSQAVCWYVERGGRKYLTLYIVPSSANPNTAAIKGHLEESLPPYMVPTFIEVMPDGIPCTVNGKVDYSRLPAPIVDRADDTYVEADSDVERAVQRIWKSLLGLEKVSVASNFFGIGGDSILVIKMIALATKSGIELTVEQVFTHQTIRELARSIEVEKCSRQSS